MLKSDPFSNEGESPWTPGMTNLRSTTCPVILDIVGSSLKETVWCNSNSKPAFEV